MDEYYTYATEADSDLSSGEEASKKEEARLKATQRSRDLREKLKKRLRRREKEGVATDPEPPHGESDIE